MRPKTIKDTHSPIYSTATPLLLLPPLNSGEREGEREREREEAEARWRERERGGLREEGREGSATPSPPFDRSSVARFRSRSSVWSFYFRDFFFPFFWQIFLLGYARSNAFSFESYCFGLLNGVDLSIWLERVWDSRPLFALLCWNG